MTDEDVRAVPRGSVRPGGGFGGGFGSLTPERARVLLIVATRASSVTLLIVFGLVFGTLAAAGSGYSGASGAIAASWLAVHQVPLTIGKTAIGLWPLLPTGFLLWLAARDCAAAAAQYADSEDRDGNHCTPVDLAWIAGAAVGGPLLITAICLAVADDAAAVVPLQPPNTLSAFGWVIGLHLLAVLFGVGARHWRDFAELAPIPVPDWVVPGVRAGFRAAWRLAAVAGVAVLVSFLVHFASIGDTYATAGNFVGVLGLSLLSLAYLPNAVIDTVSVLVGGELRVGPGSLSLFGVEGAPVPAVPLAAAVPSGPAAGWWFALLLAPAAVAVLCGLDCARSSDDRPGAPWATLTAAGVVAALFTLIALPAGGELGTFGWIGPSTGVSAVLVALWFAAGGFLGLFGARWFAIPAAGAAGVAAAGAAYDPVADDDYAETDYADDDYDDAEYADDYYEDSEYEDDRYDDEYADDEYYDDYETPRDTDEIDGELVDEPLALDVESPAESEENADIVDAEVVEGDLPDKS
ncbi:cell division protein PerM [Nocardia sp. NPDC003693]